MFIPRTVMALIGLLSLPAQAGSFELSGANMTLPDGFVLVEEKREMTSKDRFVHEISSTRSYRNVMALDGDNRVVLKVIIRHIPGLPLKPSTEEKLAESLKAAVAKYPAEKVTLLPFGSTRGLYIDEPYTPPAVEGKPAPKPMRFATLGAIAADARVEILFLYPPSLLAPAETFKLFEAMRIDEARIKQMIAESDSIRKAAVTGARIQTQAGTFEMQSGSAIQFGSLSMTRNDSGSNVMTNFFVQKDGFWTSQRAGVVISCLPGGIMGTEAQDKAHKSVLESAKAQTADITTQRQKIGGIDSLKSKYSLSGLDTTTWFVFGPKSTLVATLMGITTDKFEQQFEKSPGFTQGQCARIPGSQLDSGEAAL
jgi:hypothetical protein